MSESRSFESHISADLPIKAREEDRLNRAGFAEALARAIRTWRKKPSLVVGLFGEWGSGKSSLKNLVLESIIRDEENKLYVVEFSPWQVSSQDLLSETFFKEIGSALGKTGSSEEAVIKRRVARWKKYAGILSIAGTVARAFRSVAPPTDHSSLALTSAATTIESIAAVTKAGAETIEAEGATDSLTLSELKAQIGEDLLLLDRPILVVLDDIDRLTKEEIRHTLQLVKANADFPNIVYLLIAQREGVLNALKEIAPDSPLAYLEKIIQVSFDVPIINRKQLQDFLLKGINGILSGPEFEKRLSNEYWTAIFATFFSLFRNLRDINRFLGSLSFHVQLFMNGTTFEVNPVDLIVLEAIRLFEPKIYQEIAHSKDILTKLPRWQRDEEAEADNQRIQALISLSSLMNKQAIFDLIANVFPPCRLRKGLAYQGSDSESRWFQDLRACSYQAFDRYFQFATPAGDVSQAHIDQLIASMDDTAELDSIFIKLGQSDLLDTTLTRIAAIKTSLPLTNAATFLAGLYNIKIPKRWYSFFEPSPQSQIRSITYWYLQPLTEDKRLEVMEEALHQTRGLSLAISTVELLAHAPDQGSTTPPFFQEQASRDQLNQAGLEAIIRARDSQQMADDILLSSTFWWRFDSAAATEWLHAYLNNRSAVSNYLDSLVLRSEGTGGTRKAIAVNGFEHLISIEELDKSVDEHLTGELTADEVELVRLFKKAVRKRQNGTDHSHRIWDDDSD